MASTYTLNSGIEKPGIGDQSGEWGTTINTNMDILDRATNGVGAITLSGTTHTLTTTDGALSDGQYKVLVLGGSPSGTNTITIAPNNADKVYIVVNSSGETATFTQGGGANVSVLNGDSKIIYADGAGSGAAIVDVTADLSFSSVNIDGGSIDGTPIGAASASTGAFTSLTVGAAAISEAELEMLDGITAGTVLASKAVVVDSSKDITGFNNITLAGELDAASLDIEGDADINGTLEADAITLGGSALGTLYSPLAGSSSIATVGTVGTGTWQGTAIADTYVASDLTISGGTVNNSIIGGSTPAAGTFAALTTTGNVILGDAVGDNVTFNAGTATIPNNLVFSGTGTVKMPSGTTAQRPTGAAGMFRYNSTTGKFEGYTAAWGSVGGGATGGGSDEVFVENSDDVTVDYTITSGKNAMSVGPITLASGVDVTIPSGSRWVVL